MLLTPEPTQGRNYLTQSHAHCDMHIYLPREVILSFLFVSLFIY